MITPLPIAAAVFLWPPNVTTSASIAQPSATPSTSRAADGGGPNDTEPTPESSVSAEQAPGDIRAFWKDGFKFETADKNFTAKFGGRLHFDVGGINTDDDYEAAVGGREEDGAKFRRARMYMSGDLYQTVEYKWQYEFAGGTDNKLKDVYLGLKDSPVGGIRVGQFKEPFSIEELTSSNHTTFMERSPMNALVPQRNIGLMVHDHNESTTVTWAAGVFRDDGSDTGASDGDGEHSATARVTWLPFHEEDYSQFVHVGAAYSIRKGNEDTFRFSSKGQSGLITHTAVDTGTLNGDSADLAGVEAAWVRGPLSLQAEYVRMSVDLDAGSDPDFGAWYILASYFLTGESRAYKASLGAFDRTAPYTNYSKDGGGGAWEVAAGLSELDLTDASVAGGELTDAIAGATWYLNPNVKVMFNYVRQDVEPVAGSDGSADIFMVRFALEF